MNAFFVLSDVVRTKLFSADVHWISRWVDEWDESTDPQKFVFEDIGIAAFLLSLWEIERTEQHIDKYVSSSFPFSISCFVDSWSFFAFGFVQKAKFRYFLPNSSLSLNNFCTFLFLYSFSHSFLNSGSWSRKRIFGLYFDFSMCHFSISCWEEILCVCLNRERENIPMIWNEAWAEWVSFVFFLPFN